MRIERFDLLSLDLRRVPNEKLVDELMIELHKMERERAAEEVTPAQA